MSDRYHLILCRQRKKDVSSAKNFPEPTCEQRLLAALPPDQRLAVTVVPHLYDLAADGPALGQLRSLRGHLVVAARLPERAIYWLLRRLGIHGTNAAVEDLSEIAPTGNARPGDAPADAARRLWCVDLRKYSRPEACAEMIGRILSAAGLRPRPGGEPVEADEVDEPTSPRWYPVVDYERCVNCLECLNFCLFGVFGLDASDTVLVEQPDACRPGCPACARVCPSGAIMFPEHPDPGISGEEADRSDTRPGDLTKLLPVLDAFRLAAAERASATTAASPAAASQPPQDQQHPSRESSRLDDLVDGLDDVEL